MSKRNCIILAFLMANFASSANQRLADSLPACIAGMKKMYPHLSATPYEYKGQPWFLIVQDTMSSKVIKNSDPQTYLKFYDSTCKLVCTWVKGGIGAINRVFPDSIEKEKIRKIEMARLDTIQNPTDSLPAAIIKLARQQNAIAIQPYQYGEQSLFYLAVVTLPMNQLVQKGISSVPEKYFDSDGKWVATFSRATSGTFLRVQHWEPHSFVPGNLVKGKAKWVIRNNVYVPEF